MVLFNEAWNPKRRGLGSAFVQGSAVLGSGSASVVAIWAITTFSPNWGWRVALLTGGSPILVMIFIRIFMPESKAWLRYDSMKKQGELSVEKAKALPLAEMFKKPLLTITITGFIWMMSYMLCYYSIVTFIPTLMLRYMNTPPYAVRTTAVALSFASGIAYLTNGWLHDRFGRRLGSVMPASVWIISMVGMYVWGSAHYQGSVLAWPLFWLYVAFGVGNVALGVAGTWLSELYPLDLRSTAVSVIYMGGRALGSVAPVVVPLVALHFGGKLLIGMVVTALPCAVIFVISSLCLPETVGRDLSYAPK
jgi:MFS family permease